MIFWYLNKTNNKWHKANLEQDVIDAYEIKVEHEFNVPNHVGQAVPVLQFYKSEVVDGIINSDDTLSQRHYKSTVYAKGKIDGAKHMIPIEITEESYLPYDSDPAFDNINTDRNIIRLQPTPPVAVIEDVDFSISEDNDEVPGTILEPSFDSEDESYVIPPLTLKPDYATVDRSSTSSSTEDEDHFLDISSAGLNVPPELDINSPLANPEKLTNLLASTSEDEDEEPEIIEPEEGLPPIISAPIVQTPRFNVRPVANSSAFDDMYNSAFSNAFARLDLPVEEPIIIEPTVEDEEPVAEPTFTRLDLPAEETAEEPAPVVEDAPAISIPDPVEDPMAEYNAPKLPTMANTEINSVTVRIDLASPVHDYWTNMDIEGYRREFKKTQPIQIEHSYNQKIKNLKTNKTQQSRYVKDLNKTAICYINRDGLAVRIEKKFGGGYIKTIGAGFTEDGSVFEILGVKQRNRFFKNSFGAKDEYNDTERMAIHRARSGFTIKGTSEITATAPDQWDARLQDDRQFVTSKNKIVAPKPNVPNQTTTLPIETTQYVDSRAILPVKPLVLTMQPKLTPNNK